MRERPDEWEVSTVIDGVLEVRERIRGVAERLFAQEEGQGMVEYALILVLISIVVIVVLGTMGKTVNNVFSNINKGLRRLGFPPGHGGGPSRPRGGFVVGSGCVSAAGCALWTQAGEEHRQDPRECPEADVEEQDAFDRRHEVTSEGGLRGARQDAGHWGR